jgi:hypothetical protein
MKYVFSCLSVTFVGYPTLVLSYLWSAAKSGWSLGAFLYQRHEDAAIAKFVNKGGKDAE